MATSDVIANGKLRARRRNRAMRERVGEAAQGAPLAAHCRTNSHRGSSDLNTRSYPPVEAIARALRVLRTVSELQIATIGEVFSATGIPKSTIVRVLETLISEGYVARDNLCGGYRITSKANELGAGYEGISRVIEIARPTLIHLTERTQWSVGIGTFDDDAIWLRFSTAALCKRAPAVSLGWRLDLFYTAMGRAYLAFCPTAERERIFKACVDSGLSTPADEVAIRALLPQIRDKGYAERAESRSVAASSVATPIFGRSSLLAVMNLSYFKDAVSHETIGAEIARPLLDARATIEAAIQHEPPIPPRASGARPSARAGRVPPIKLDDNLSGVVT